MKCDTCDVLRNALLEEQYKRGDDGLEFERIIKELKSELEKERERVKELRRGLASIVKRVDDLQDSPKSLLHSLTEDLPQMREALRESE